MMNATDWELQTAQLVRIYAFFFTFPLFPCQDIFTVVKQPGNVIPY